MAKYSIVLPVRNGGEYVKECVNSILSQTLKDFNLHILDNCSTDGTSEWLGSLRDERIIICPSERPLTIEENWARITSIQKNEFVTLIGHDDLLEPNYLEIMDGLISDHPDASLYQAHFKFIDSMGGLLRNCRPMAKRLSAPEFLAFFLCNMIDSMGTGFMMRSKDYDAIGGIPGYPNLLFADFELWINLTKPSFMAISFEEGFSFRLHKSMTTTSSDIKFQNAFRRFVCFLETLKMEPELDKVIQRYGLNFISFYTKGLAHRLLRTPIAKREGKTVRILIEECKKYADLLVPGNEFNPYSIFSVKLAKQIDSNNLSRSLFLLFKKIYSKPLYS
ncbi:MAG: glycosyltransferase family 2 protein [Flavisolibacter sp.]